METEAPPGKLVLVMDGECAVCSWGARTIAAHDSGDLFRIAPLQGALGRSLLIRHGLDPGDPESWLLLKDGEALTGARAVIAAGRRLSMPWLGSAPVFPDRCASRPTGCWRATGSNGSAGPICALCRTLRCNAG